MQTQTKMEIRKPAEEVFEAFVNPEKIGHFWFSSSSERWAAGKKITLRYDEYDAEGEILILTLAENEKIVYEWGGEEGEPRQVTITFAKTGPGVTVVEVVEKGFAPDDPELIPKLLDNQGGWVFVLSCLKVYLELGSSQLRGALLH